MYTTILFYFLLSLSEHLQQLWGRPRLRPDSLVTDLTGTGTLHQKPHDLKNVSFIQHNTSLSVQCYRQLYPLLIILLQTVTVTNILTSLSARLGSTTLASGMLTGSLLGWTVLRGILIGRLVMLLSPWTDGLFSLPPYLNKKEIDCKYC